jgi:hypothetical protein
MAHIITRRVAAALRMSTTALRMRITPMEM